MAEITACLTTMVKTYKYLQDTYAFKGEKMFTIELPETLLETANISPEEIKVELAVRLFEQKRLSIYQAHLLAGSDSVADFYNTVIQKTVAEYHEKPEPHRLEQLEILANHLLTVLDLVKYVADNRIVSTFIRSPLQSIMGLSKVIANGSIGTVTEEQKKLLDQNFHSAQALYNYLGILIDVKPYIFNEGKTYPREVEAIHIIDDFLAKTKEKTKFYVEQVVSIELPTVMVDRVEIDRAIYYLLEILKQIHPSGEGKLDLNASFQNPWVSISFFTEGNGDAELKAPTNLAVYIVQSIFELHGGSMKILDLPNGVWKIECKLPAKNT